MRAKGLVLFVIVFTFFCGYFSSYADSPILPFAVTVGGQGAVAEKENAVYATIITPVSNEAEIFVDDNSNMVIMNIFPSDSSGIVAQGAQPAIIMLQDDNKTTLDKTMDKKKLDQGYYLMNVMSSGKTARVLFQVE